MNNKIFALVCLLLVGVAAYAERDKWMPVKPSPASADAADVDQDSSPPQHLAPEGTFYMLEYVSAHTPHGLTGFVPGQAVRLVSADKATQTLLVSDGTNQVAVSPSQITNDLDIAALVGRRDQQSQQELQRRIAAERNPDAKIERRAEKRAAKDLRKYKSGSTIGTSTTLSRGSTAASSVDAAKNAAIRNGYRSGNPYYYLQ